MGDNVKTDRALISGMAGGLVMTALAWIARATMDLPSNMEMMFGTMFGMRQGTSAWLLGLGIHLAGSALIALIYAWSFERVTHRANWLIGGGIGSLHALIAGGVMGFMPEMHALIPEHMPAPGFFMANMGAMPVILDFAMHMIYGAIVGAAYGRVAPPSM
jgi:hypothetical protein